MLYVGDCLFWALSQSNIDNVMKSFKDDYPNYNWEKSKLESVYEFLGIDTKTLDDGVFQFFQTELICKVLEATGMGHCNGFPTPTKAEATLGKYEKVFEADRYCPNSYASVIGMMLYLSSDTRQDISFAVHQCV